MPVHPTAVVSPEAEIDPSAEVGPYCIISGRVRIGAGVRLLASVHLHGPVTIGPGTIAYPGVCLGYPPQDYKFKPGDATGGVVIGRDCLLREHATVHAATKPDTPTRVGDRVFMMVGSHLGHDAEVGNDVILVNHAGLAGHAKVGDKATLSGSVLVHQFVRIGRLAFMSGGTGVSMDVPPFCMVPDRNRLGGINLVGLRRSGFSRDEITEVRRAFRDVFRPCLPRGEMIDVLRRRGESSPAVAEMAEFVATAKRPICPGKGRPPRDLTTWLQNRRRGRHLAPMDGDGEDEFDRSAL